MKKFIVTISFIFLNLLMLQAYACDAFQVKEGLAGVEYVCDGVGEIRRDTFKELRSDYNLQLVFANKAGEYVADVMIDVVDLSNYDEVIHDVAEGPLLYAKLPTGNYNVVVNYKGEQITKKIKVTGEKTRINIYYHFNSLM